MSVKCYYAFLTQNEFYLYFYFHKKMLQDQQRRKVHAKCSDLLPAVSLYFCSRRDAAAEDPTLDYTFVRRTYANYYQFIFFLNIVLSLIVRHVLALHQYKYTYNECVTVRHNYLAWMRMVMKAEWGLSTSWRPLQVDARRFHMCVALGFPQQDSTGVKILLWRWW